MMRKIFCGSSGSNRIPSTHRLSEIDLSRELVSAFVSFYGSDILLRPAQDAALFDGKLLSSQTNTIITTPTNSGKTLLSCLLLFQHAANGETVILVEPLRALAYEKSEELKEIAGVLQRQSNIKIKITITTGDYRLTDEQMFSRPQETSKKSFVGSIIVATPERLDAISRVAENEEWFNNISLVCIDEAHLVGDANRGAALELLIAFLRSRVKAPRIVLMSASISNPEDFSRWLAPCTAIGSIQRYPKLNKWVYCVDEDENINDFLMEEIKQVLLMPGTSVVVFVYQTASAESFAVALAQYLTEKKIKPHDLSAAVNAGVAWFHANLSSATKESIISDMISGRIRATVSTTALAMGINLPATHVFVRDITFAGVGDLDVSELLQMLGRAGRGSTEGTGIVLLSKNNLAKEQEIVRGLTEEILPVVSSQLVPIEREYQYGSSEPDYFYIDRVGNQLMGVINRIGNVTLSSLKEYLGYTLGGERITGIQEILDYLNRWKLVYYDEDTQEYQLTHLGKVASTCYMPPITAANAAQFFRDLLQDDPSGAHIMCMTPIDYFIVLCLISDETRPLARFSKSMEARITEYMEALPLEDKSYLYRTWIASTPDSIYGSSTVIATHSAADAKKKVLQNVFTAMFLYDLSHGISGDQLKNYYRIEADEIQEKLRDNTIWLLCGLEKMLKVRSFYFHLKSNCEADSEQIRSVDCAFHRASQCLFENVANLKFRSKLGEAMRGIKKVFPHAKSFPGDACIRSLEGAGINSIKDLVGKSSLDLQRMGVRKAHAELIAAYINKRRS